MDDTGTEQDQKAAADDDESTDDESTDDESTDDESTNDAQAPDDDRLDELGDRIQSVRAEAEDVVEGVADTDEKYADSGDEKSTDEDDQTIAPPG